jgi:hypothetical protein
LKFPEHPHDAAARRAEQAEDGKLRRFKERSVLVMSGLGVVALGVMAFWMLFHPQEFATTQEFARGTLSAMATGFLGYLVGKQGK